MRSWYVVLFVVLMLSACAAPASTTGTSGGSAGMTRPAQVDTTTSLTSKNGIYHISYTADLKPLAINKLHSWTVHIETPEGQAVDGATVTVHGGMPEHNHGLPTAPVVTPEGSGNYRVEGMKFQMPGWWTVTVDVAAGGRQDSATFNLLLD